MLYLDIDDLIDAAFEEEDTLEHHGVKGMKWGVRKDRKRSLLSVLKRRRRKRSRSKRQPQEDNTPEVPKKKRRLSDLSNKEIQELVNRKRLETQYMELYHPKKPKKETFGQRLGKQMGDSIVNIIKKTGEKGAEKLASAIINKAFGSNDNKSKGGNTNSNDSNKKTQDTPWTNYAPPPKSNYTPPPGTINLTRGFKHRKKRRRR